MASVGIERAETAAAPSRAGIGVGGVFFASCALGVAILAAVLAGWVPLGFSIVTVFLFAGPHNWYEFRYFLSRMPARWGPRKAFYLLGIGGAAGLAVLFAGASFLGRFGGWSLEGWERSDERRG